MRHPAGMGGRWSTVSAIAGWFLVVVLGLLVLLETLILTAMASLLSLILAVVPVLLVVAALVLALRGAGRRSRT